MSVKATTDQSPPRNGAIAFYSVLTVVSLVGLKFVFDSYFHMMIDNVRAERAAVALLPLCAPGAAASDVGVSCRRTTSSMDQLQHMRARETEMLAGGHGATAIDTAMQALAQNRQNPAVVPQPSSEMAPIKGWTNIPHFVTTARPTMDLTAAPAPAPAPAVDPAAAPTAAVDSTAATVPNAPTVHATEMVPANEVIAPPAHPATGPNAIVPEQRRLGGATP
ncbi:MAG: hypothetical protein IPK60_00710 [Sandaracinaceae bacterium]|nr:hypothetical protein [Sandaracinaceae bacterium]